MKTTDTCLFLRHGRLRITSTSLCLSRGRLSRSPHGPLRPSVSLEADCLLLRHGRLRITSTSLCLSRGRLSPSPPRSFTSLCLSRGRLSPSPPPPSVSLEADCLLHRHGPPRPSVSLEADCLLLLLSLPLSLCLSRGRLSPSPRLLFLGARH